MSDQESLLLVIAALYLSECCWWIDRTSVPLRAWLGRRCRVVNPNVLFGNAAGAVLWRNPLPPLGEAYVTQAWPLSISPEGVCSFTLFSHNPGVRPDRPRRFIPFSEIQSVEQRDREVRINGQVFVRTGSNVAARNVVEVIERVGQAAAVKRAALITAALDASLDSAEAARLVRAQHDVAKTLRVFTNLLFLYVFVATPAVIWQFGLSGHWHWLLGGLAVLLSWTLMEYWLAHRELYPGRRPERLTHLVLMLLLPLKAIRAGDAMRRDLLAGCHPAAAAFALCDDRQFRFFASGVWRDAVNPCPLRDSNEDDAAAREASAWFSQQYREALRRMLEGVGIELDEVTAPPQADGSECRHYCPRCHGLFTSEGRACESCGGLALRALSGASADSLQAVESV